MKTTIFTIGRQYGSGGHEIGEKLAERFHIPFYDSKLIDIAAKKSGVSEDVFESVDEKTTNSFLYSLSMGAMGYGTSGYVDMSINDKLFIALSDIIQGLAKQGSCVIVGRCADYILRDFNNCINIFCYGEMEDREKRISSVLKISTQKAAGVIRRKDKTKANFYNYYSNQKWGAKENYHLLINTSALPIDKAVSLIEAYAKLQG